MDSEFSVFCLLKGCKIWYTSFAQKSKKKTVAHVGLLQSKALTEHIYLLKTIDKSILLVKIEIQSLLPCYGFFLHNHVMYYLEK